MILILSLYLFLRNVLFRHKFVHEFMRKFVHEFMREFAHQFVHEFFANFVHESKYEFARIRMNFLHEKLVMLRMACTVNTFKINDL